MLSSPNLAGSAHDSDTFARKGRTQMPNPVQDRPVDELPIALLAQLHEGNILRYGLRHAEFRTWLTTMGPET
jgi:hypothetical protein